MIDQRQYRNTVIAPWLAWSVTSALGWTVAWLTSLYLGWTGRGSLLAWPLAGVVGGLVASIGQRILLFPAAKSWRWVLHSAFGWGIAWGIGFAGFVAATSVILLTGFYGVSSSEGGTVLKVAIPIFGAIAGGLAGTVLGFGLWMASKDILGDFKPMLVFNAGAWSIGWAVLLGFGMPLIFPTIIEWSLTLTLKLAVIGVLAGTLAGLVSGYGTFRRILPAASD